MPELHNLKEGEKAQDQGQNHQDGLGGDENAALPEAIHQSACIQGEKHHGKELDGGHKAQAEGGAGEFQDQPGLGDALDPGPYQGEDLPGPVNAVVAVAHGGEGSRQGGSYGSHGGFSFLLFYWMQAFLFMVS